MAEDKNKKIGFFRRILISIKDFEQYQIFAVENIGKAVKYLLKLMLIFTVVMCLVFTYKFSVSIKDGIQYFKDNINEITYQQGNLTVNAGEPILIENENSILQAIIVATNSEGEDQKQYLEKIEKYPNGIIFFKDKMVFRNEMVNANTEYQYSDIASSYHIGEFNKDNILDVISHLSFLALYVAFFLTMFLYMFVIYLTSTVVDVLMLAVLGFIIARIAGMRIKFKAIFNMGVYALTLPILLNLVYIVVNNFTGFTIQYFQWMYTTISYIYMIVAILMIKTDLVNRKMEVMKLEEEQEKVRQELEDKEEPEENKKSDKDKPTKEKEEEKKQGNNLGEEPEGV